MTAVQRLNGAPAAERLLNPSCMNPVAPSRERKGEGRGEREGSIPPRFAKCMKDEKRNKERNRQRLRRSADETAPAGSLLGTDGLKRLSFLPSSMEDATSGERAAEQREGGEQVARFILGKGRRRRRII